MHQLSKADELKYYYVPVTLVCLNCITVEDAIIANFDRKPKICDCGKKYIVVRKPQFDD